MSETKFTPGPWRKGRSFMSIIADHPTGFDDETNVNAYGGFLVCESVKCDANAHLIAAAPDLYEALRKTEEMFDMKKGIDEGEYNYRQEVRAALAKARGEMKE